MKKLFVTLAVLVFLVGVVSITPKAFAANATVTETPTADDIHEINNMTPGSSKTFLGTRLDGLLTNETTTYTTSGSKDFDTDDKVILFTTPADGGINDATYANGEPGQTVTFVLVTDGGKNVDVTPVTATGFTSVTLDSANDTCTLLYQDDTVGWVSLGGNSCTVN